jgi:parallel beta-helix repeat protein
MKMGENIKENFAAIVLLVVFIEIILANFSLTILYDLRETQKIEPSKFPYEFAGQGQIDDIIITSNFDQGNLVNITYVPGSERAYNGKIRMSNFSMDPTTDPMYQWWFYFKATNCSGKTFIVNITNLLDLDVTENRWRNIWPVYSYNNLNWSRLGLNNFTLHEVTGNNNYFTINFTCPLSQNSVWFAALPPYPKINSDNFISNLKMQYPKYVNVTKIGISENYTNVTLVTITDFDYGEAGKKKILVISGQHMSSEPQGVYALEKMMSFLTSSDTLASELRKNFTFKFVHLTNIDGAQYGIPRYNVRDEDLNREWNQNPPSLPSSATVFMASEIWAIKQQRISWLPDILLDLHGTINDDNNYFIAPSTSNTSYNNLASSLMYNISKYWPETGARGISGIPGAAIQNAYDENKTLALLLEWSPTCIDGGSGRSSANISTCIGHYLVTENDWRNDGISILRGLADFYNISAEIDYDFASCTVINSPGVYSLTGDITNSTNYSCITISSNNVVLDGQGHTIDGIRGLENSQYGIYVNKAAKNLTNVTIKNLILTDWNSVAVYFKDVYNSNVLNVNANSNEYGIYLNTSSYVNITSCNITSNTLDGIRADSSNNSNLMNNTANSNYRGLALYTSSTNIIANNNLDTNAGGLDIYSSNNNLIIKNTANFNGYNGIALYESSDNNLTNNTANSNGGKGIYLDASSNNILTNNNAGSNNEGIYLLNSNDNIFKNNNADSSSEDFGIYLESSSNNILTNNTANSNSNNYGIYLESSDTNNLTDNNISLNGGGILIRTSNSNNFIDNFLLNNARQYITLDSGSQNNIFINQTINNVNVSFTAYDLDIYGITNLPGSYPSGYQNIGKFIEATTHSSDAWLYLNISYEPGDLNGVTESTLRMSKYNGTTWFTDPSTFSSTYGLNTQQKYVYANITNFGSVFSPLGTLPSSYVSLNSPTSGYEFPKGTTNILFEWLATSDANQEINCSVYVLSNYYTKTCQSATACNQTISGFSSGSYSWRVNCSDGVNQFSAGPISFKIKSSPPSCCLLPGTLIKMADGSEKVIESINIGDKILSFDLFNGKFVESKVTKIENPIREGYYDINNLLKITNEHPIYMKNEEKNYEGWLQVEKLKLGDYLFTQDRTWLKIDSIKYIEGDVQTYNLKFVNPWNDYFANNILVHNKGGGCTENWTCSDWTSCLNGQQIRACQDLSNCGTNYTQPTLVQNCTSLEPEILPCTEQDWQCDDWQDCINNQQVRDCQKLKDCNITSGINKELTKSCQEQEQPPKEKENKVLQIIFLISFLVAMIAGIFVVIWFLLQKNKSFEYKGFGTQGKKYKEETEEVPSAP